MIWVRRPIEGFRKEIEQTNELQNSKKVQALSKSDRWYTQQEIHDAWLHVITGAYGDAIIYSLYDLADKPYIKLDDINPKPLAKRKSHARHG